MTTEEYLQLSYTTHKDDVENVEKLIEFNIELLKEYPFLRIAHETGYFDTNLFTWADDIPYGWRIAFGDVFFKELKEALIECNSLSTYRVFDVEERYGELCWHAEGYPFNSKVDEVIFKYKKLSKITCIDCGRPAKYRTTGWIEPYCENCISSDAIKNAKILE